MYGRDYVHEIRGREEGSYLHPCIRARLSVRRHARAHGRRGSSCRHPSMHARLLMLKKSMACTRTRTRAQTCGTFHTCMCTLTQAHTGEYARTCTRDKSMHARRGICKHTHTHAHEHAHAHARGRGGSLSPVGRICAGHHHDFVTRLRHVLAEESLLDLNLFCCQGRFQGHGPCL